jgi:arylsulfatase A-like enzyme
MNATRRALCLAALSLAGAAPRAAEKANVVFILADDLGWTDLGCMGSRYYETPRLDALAAGGMKFTQAYTCGPNCAPTRAALMSGQYGPRTGIYTVSTGARGKEEFRKLVPAPNRTDLAPEVVTLAESLRAAGYATGMFGKWHLGEGPSAPPRQGFDVFAPTPKGKEFPGTAALAKAAADFIVKNQDRPFFLYLPLGAVHSPIQHHSPELEKKYAGKAPAGGHRNPVYAAMVEEMDRGVGEVLGKLDELKLAERTLVLFSSDNGGVGGYRSAGVKGGGETTHNAPLRGGKGMLYEGGIRVPLLVRWPGRVAPGAVCEEPVLTVDFYPTLLEVAGAKPDPSIPLDGRSLVSLFGGRGPLGREALYWHFPGYLEAGAQEGTWRTAPCGAIRCGDWKLQEFFEDGRAELYNLKDDVGESKNLAASMPEKVEELRRKLADWRKAVGAPMPQPK